LAEKCCLQLAYAIGVAEPLSIYVDTYGTEEVDPLLIERIIRENVNLTPRAIRTRLGLNRPIYRRTAAYGHFGRDPEADGGFSWERLDLADVFRSAL
jgi:S-adenosylmethionine synthetase